MITNFVKENRICRAAEVACSDLARNGKKMEILAENVYIYCKIGCFVYTKCNNKTLKFSKNRQFYIFCRPFQELARILQSIWAKK